MRLGDITGTLKTIGLTVGFHWITFLLALFVRGELTSPIHLYYEPFIFQVLLLLDLPAILLAEEIVSPLNPSLTANSIANLAGLFAIVTLQWICIGIILDLVISTVRKSRSTHPV